jgi:cytochrome c biogenesis protein
MPKLFASDIVVIDHKTGERIPARVEVNKPFTYDGVSIYQSSFQDGGSQMQMTAFRWSAAPVRRRLAVRRHDRQFGAAFPCHAGGVTARPSSSPISARSTSRTSRTAAGANDVRGVAHQTLKEAFDERLGSGAKTSKPLDLHNVGPSVQYKVRGKDGQAREYNNYMLPVDVAGEKMFLAGMRVNPDDPFRYLRIPADQGGTVNEWMNLRAALENPATARRRVAPFRGCARCRHRTRSAAAP